MLLIASLLAAALAGSPDPAPTAPPLAPAPPSAAAPVDDGDTVVCKSVEVTGSLFKSRICHTKRDWAEMTRNGREMVDHAHTGCGPKGCGN